MERNPWLITTRTRFRLVKIYYIFLLAVGLIATVYIIPNVDELVVAGFSVMKLTIVGSLSSCTLGVSVHYLRKLYTMQINEGVKFEECCEPKYGGVYWYLYLRPVFSWVIVVVFICMAKVGFVSMVSPLGQVNDRFVIGMMSLSFFIGLSVKQFLNKLTSLACKIANDLDVKRG